MAWRESPQTLIDLFDRAVPRSRDIQRRRMFGYPAAFLDGHLFAGLHQEDFILRLPKRPRAARTRRATRSTRSTRRTGG
jgi:TfoX/Sxy family transcriptional regulator of competence genes